MRTNKEILKFVEANRDLYRELQLEPFDVDDEDCCAGCHEDGRVDAYDEIIEFIIDLSDTQKAVRELQENADRKNRHWARILNGDDLPPVKEMQLPMTELEARGMPNPFQNKLYYIMKWFNTG